VRENMGLDQPAVTRYFDWLTGILQGDLGHSITTGQSVSSLVSDRFKNTFILATITTLVLLPVAIFLGAVTGKYAGRPVDHIVSLISLALIALPEFVVGMLLIYFVAIRLGWFPPVALVLAGSSPLGDPVVLALPVLTLCLVGLGYMVRMVRAGMIDVMASDYVRLARLSGIPEWRVILRYALPNALAPSIQVTALTLQWLIGGIFVVETVFAYPGIGQGLVQSVVARDIPTVQSVALIIAAIYISINVLADVAVVLLIPRLRAAPR
jgi:peptide/nickel transport system permease protein